MDRREQHAALLPLTDHGLENAVAMIGGHLREAVVENAVFAGVVRMDLHKRLRQMRAQARAQAAAGHGVPLVADAPGIEPQWPAPAGLAAQRRRFRRNEARLAVAGVETPFLEKPRLR